MVSNMLCKQLEYYLDGLHANYEIEEDYRYKRYEVSGKNYKVFIELDKENEVFLQYTLNQDRYEICCHRMEKNEAREKAIANRREYKTITGVANYIDRYFDK